jgi:hypothetical protein
MAQKTKSIIEEALLEAKTLEDALKANTKEMLSAHMSKEIESIVESSLREQEEEEDIEMGSDDDEMDVVELDDESDDEMGDVDLDLDAEMEMGDDEEEVDLDLDTDLDLDAGEEMDDVEMDLELPSMDTEMDVDMDMDMDMGMDLGMDVIDMRNSSDEEVVTVFKHMPDDAEIEVVKDSGGIFLKDKETNAEYYIKESMDEMMNEKEYCSECGSGSMYEMEDMDEEVMYEIEMDEDMMEMYHSMKKEGYGKKHMKEMDHMDEMEEDYHMKEGAYIDEEEEGLEEDLARTRGYARQGNRRHGASHNPTRKDGTRFSESKRKRRTLNRKNRKSNRVSENKFLKEYNELKSKNEEYKKALKVFKNKLNEVALFNTNLAYVNRLFTEHSTTKKEKMDILKRFDNAESIKESKTIYKSVKGELERKAPINESVDKKVNKTIKSSQATNLNESTAYVDPQISAIKDLMKRIS